MREIIIRYDSCMIALSCLKENNSWGDLGRGSDLEISRGQGQTHIFFWEVAENWRYLWSWEQAELCWACLFTQSPIFDPRGTAGQTPGQIQQLLIRGQRTFSTKGLRVNILGFAGLCPSQTIPQFLEWNSLWAFHEQWTWLCFAKYIFVDSKFYISITCYKISYWSWGEN